MTADADGFLQLGGVGLLVDGRDDVAAGVAEPTRMILNLHAGGRGQLPVRGERAAWFRDSEGNLHGVGQAIP